MLFEIDKKNESKFKNDEFSKENLKKVLCQKPYIKKGIKLKIFDGRYDKIFNKLNQQYEAIWTLINPLAVQFSWKDKYDNNFAFTISLHVPPYIFEKYCSKFFYSI